MEYQLPNYGLIYEGWSRFDVVLCNHRESNDWRSWSSILMGDMLHRSVEGKKEIPDTYKVYLMFTNVHSC